ncbi:hypothetical protein [Muricoccus radiodurans]|uniref:hypothetical protein n=1 Tax=Muricoccus radiodurans TaxID=2231721 RepID=UPI003CE6DA2A
MSAALQDPEDHLALIRAEVASAFLTRLREDDRKRRGVKAGDVDWLLIACLCLDPVESWRFGKLLGAEAVAAVHGAGGLEWWPGDPEPATEYALPDRALFVGRYTGRSYDSRTKTWAPDPIARLALHRGIKPGRAAHLICREFGMGDLPHVA